MRALVVDDEAPARRRLLRLLARSSEIEVASEAASADEALAHVRRRAPDVVFLDVRMPGIDGLELAKRCGARTAIVFVTAHAEHAARAFDLDSVDYLLKPVRFERLAEAIGRVRARRVPSDPAPRIVAHERGEMVVVSALTVTRFRASDKYTAFVVDGRELLTEESLASLEARLGRSGFVRVHRSELVRLDAVQALRTEDGSHSLRLHDGQVVPVSRRVASDVRARLRDR